MANETAKLDILLGASRAVAESPERQAVTLTLLAVDVAGTAGYFNRGEGLLTKYERMGTRAVEGYGGRVVRVLGDTMLAEFNDPPLAVQAAVHLQRRLAQIRGTLPKEDQIQLRMGVAQGLCFRAGSEISGEGVERTAAICKRAGPAQILISQELRESVAGHPDVTCMWLGQFKTAGRDENLFEVIWTEAEEYSELRQQQTMALRRGDIMVPGMQITELAQPEPGPSATLQMGAGADVIGQRTGEFVPVVPASLSKRYDIRGELGRGGMGVVYKAWDRETDELVALKVLRGEIATDDDALVRFKNEVRIARRVTHKNVCRIHDFNRAPDASYISMEFIEGRSLRSMIAETQGLPTDHAIAIARQICAGLTEAHAQGIVHRDLKPENVMIDGTGTARILDFGIARSALGAGVTQTGAVMGTPAYMAPEQASGIHIDHRADIYALGLILYEMFTGKPTFHGPTPVSVVIKHIQEQPTPPREFKPMLPEHIERTILRCLAKNPEQRFQSAMEVIAALENAVESMPTSEVKLDPGIPGARLAEPSRPAPTMAVRTVEPEPEPAAQAAAASAAAKPARAAAPAKVAAAPAAKSAGVKPLLIILAAGFLLAVLGVGGGAYYWLRDRSPDAAPQQSLNPQGGQPQAPAKDSTGTAPAPGGSTPANPAPADPGVTSGPTTIPNVPVPSPGSVTPPKKAELERPVPDPVRTLPPVTLAFSFATAVTDRSKASVSGISMSADGRLLASAAQDNVISIWEVASGRQLAKLRGHTGSVFGVAFSRDGSRLASASADKTARIWSLASGAIETTFPKESAAVLRVAFSPDGQFLAGTTADGDIKLWEVGGGFAQTLSGHSGPVYSIAFSRSGQTLVSGGRDATLRMWSIAGIGNSQEHGKLANPGGAVNAVAISPDGKMIAAAGEDGTVRVWEGGREVVTIRAHAGSADALAFGDSRWLVTGGSDKLVKVWELPSGREVASMEGHFTAITDVTLNSASRWLASSDSSGTVRLWRWK